jgi:uncharacterized protein (TIGR03790 family)
VNTACKIRRISASVVLLLMAVRSPAALQPDEIALVVNSNVPDGIKLAQFYAQQRHIPENRIVVLDLPKSDQMACRDYEDQVVPQVRDFVHTSHLDYKLKCLVSFYGVPLRIDPRVNTAEEENELSAIRQQLNALPARIAPSVEATEAIAKKLNEDFKPVPLTDLDHLFERRQNAFREVFTQIKSIPDKKRQAELADQFFQAAQPLLGDTSRIEQLRIKRDLSGNATPDDLKTLSQAEQHYQDLVIEAGQLEMTPDDAQARLRLRQIAAGSFGSLQYVRLLRDQADYLDTTASGAAFDSELAMALWKVYPHKSFTSNPLSYTNHAVAGASQTLMVTRLDAPTPEMVKAMISTSIKVEQDGLTGQLVVDSRGIKPGHDDKEHPGFGVYDRYMQDLAALTKQHTALDVSLDEKVAVLPPGSADHVAMYCGWYSVHNYVPSCKFNPGAVGYHIASYELQSLRRPGETGWVKGLLTDGVVGTLGPVDEPYLGTFPRPDDFFPLLMTGKLTLAEVYWKTEPAVSWMMDCIGDPLYTPYKTNPPLKVADLPKRLQVIFDQTPARPGPQ